MINQVILSGVVKETPEMKTTSNDFKYANLIVEVEREYRNNEGEYDVDEISIRLWRSVAENCVSLCKKGNMIIVKGRLHSSLYEREDGTIFYNYEVIADKVFCMENRVGEISSR